MSVKYCPDCGQPSGGKRFCGNCGEPLTFEARAKKQISNDLPENEEEVRVAVGDYNLDVDVEVFTPKLKLSDVIKESKTGFSRPKGNSKRGKNILREIAKECAPVRKES